MVEKMTAPQKKLFDMLPSEFIIYTEYKGWRAAGTTVRSLDGKILFKFAAGHDRAFSRLTRHKNILFIEDCSTQKHGDVALSYMKVE